MGKERSASAAWRVALCRVILEVDTPAGRAAGTHGLWAPDQRPLKK